MADGRESDVADLAKVQIASKHLLGLINGILDLSKIEAGKMGLDLTPSTSTQVVDELVGRSTRWSARTATRSTYVCDPARWIRCMRT